jgi:pilus assembly protein Flp/PilA
MDTGLKEKSHPQNFWRLTPGGEETIMDQIIQFSCDEAGSPAVEYALILAILGVALIGGMTAIGSALTGIFTAVSGKF